MKKLMVGLMMLVATSAFCAPNTTVNTPNNFTPNTTIQSSQVNSNFNEVQTQYNNHSHTDITQTGAITIGSWLGTPVATTYGGTGQNFGAAAQGTLPYFSGAGTLSALAVGANGQALTTQGAGANVKWSTVGGANDMITRGLELDYVGGGASVVASSGVVYIGSTVINSATSFTMTLANAENWASGSVVVYGAEDWCYVGVNANGKIRLLGKTPPNLSDSAGGISGTKYYIYISETTGSYWRVIGAFRENAAVVTKPWYQRGNYVAWNTPISITAATSAAVWSGVTSCSAAMPAISNLGVFGVYVTHAGSACGVWIRPNGSTWSLVDSDGNSVFGYAYVAGQRISATDNSQNIQYANHAGDTATTISLEGFYYNIR